MIIRCGDCEGLVVAHVTYVQGRPLMWAREGRNGKIDGYVWLDGEFWGTYGWCRVREWVLEASYLSGEIPPAGAPQVTARVSHNGHVGAVR